MEAKLVAAWLKGEKIFLTEQQLSEMNKHAIEKAGAKRDETEDHAYAYLVDQGIVKKSKSKKSDQ